MPKINPISGFPELLPNQQIAFQKAMGLVKSVYESFGFIPMETPVVERVEHMLAKGISAKEVYGLRRLAAEGEDGDKDLALRFDLTVPLARYVSQHYGKLTFPYRRYHMEPVWRGERAQKGRYRQFYQCDIDVIGDGSLSLNHDAEIPAIIFQIFRKMEIGDFTIRINNRKVLQGLFANVGLSSDADIKAAINVVDDLEKVPAEVTKERLMKLNISDAHAEELMSIFGIAESNEAVFAMLKGKAGENELLDEGVAELEYVLNTAKSFIEKEEQTVFANSFKIDLGIARGLDYYTGTVYETKLNAHPNIGSICSGGRYDDLAGTFSNKKLPGVGISIGLSRLVVVLIEAGLIPAEESTTADVLVTVQNPDKYTDYLNIAAELRSTGLNVEVFAEQKKLQAQLKYANKKGFPKVIIANDDELEKGLVKLKDMVSGEEKLLPVGDLSTLF